MFSSALGPCLMAIINFLFFASWQKSISFHLTEIHASRRYRIFLCLTAKINFFPPDGNSRLTAISIFLRLTARIDFICLTAIHASRRYRFFLCLTAKIDFFPPDGDSRLTAISIFLCLTAKIDFICLTAIHASRRCCRDFALSGSRFACRLVLFKRLSLVNARGCHFPGSKPVDCCLLAMFKLLRAERLLHNIPSA